MIVNCQFSIYTTLKVSFLLSCLASTRCSNECHRSSDVCASAENVITRYVLYDVNPSEGFNLRRDVYMRLAIFVKHLNTRHRKLYLVLPPWHNLPHWKSKVAGNQSNLPWGLFFNVKSLENYVPVVESYDFLENYSNSSIDHVLVLQHYQDLWNENFTWVDKWSVEPCLQPLRHRQNEDDLYEITHGSHSIVAKNVQCVSFQGPASLLKEVLSAFDGKSVFLSHAEIVLHDVFGDHEYWKCRRSIQFSDELKRIALNFKKSNLSSADEKAVNNDSNYYRGEPYLCVHFRRGDYKHNRREHIPSVEFASLQIKEKMSALNLDTVFVATDADKDEFENLSHLIRPFKTVRFIPSLDLLRSYKDGGVAIIEQIVCSYARYFVGSYESTFSFRIQEERELLDLDPNTTFNRLCGDNEKNCKQPTKWLKVE